MEKRVVIVDFNHMIHTYHHSQHRLSIKVNENGVMVDKDTTIQNGTIKNIFKWSNHGYNPMAICFDRPVPSRKAFFNSCFKDMELGTSKEYKGNREHMASEMFTAGQDVQRVLTSAGVSCFAKTNYEADDLIYACIKRAKEKYPGMPIDVVTNDADLLPLVDDTVSVFLRSLKGTFAEEKEYEKTHYIQVTPRNFSNIAENLSAYKGFSIPYNSLLLHKLLRGDMSDQFGRKDISRLFSASKYNAMIAAMQEDGVNFSEVFRYGDPQYEIRYRGTEEIFNGTLEEALASPDKSKLYQRIKNTAELDNILELLKKYSPTELSEEQLKAIEQVYWGMNLNQTYVNRGNFEIPPRRPYVVGKTDNVDINTFNEIELHKRAYDALRIQLLK